MLMHTEHKHILSCLAIACNHRITFIEAFDTSKSAKCARKNGIWRPGPRPKAKSWVLHTAPPWVADTVDRKREVRVATGWTVSSASKSRGKDNTIVKGCRTVLSITFIYLPYFHYHWKPKKQSLNWIIFNIQIESWFLDSMVNFTISTAFSWESSTR